VIGCGAEIRERIRMGLLEEAARGELEGIMIGWASGTRD
jgi:hypothetical protein